MINLSLIETWLFKPGKWPFLAYNLYDDVMWKLEKLDEVKHKDKMDDSHLKPQLYLTMLRNTETCSDGKGMNKITNKK
jgi:hypothetical protein